MAEATATNREQRGLRIVLGLAAAVLVVLAWRLPIWEARLTAPQYPQGLSLSASADGVTGDIDEVNDLNHYVGMQAFTASDAPEMALWTPTIVLALVAVGLAVALPRHPIGRLAKLGLWLIPIGALLDVQYRLYQYGHGVQHDAPIRLDPFTPLVVGPTKVLNFTTWAFPGLAIWCLFGAAFLVTFAPGLVRRARERWQHRPVYVSDEEYDALERAGRV
jgi:copper chaperone NosL